MSTVRGSENKITPMVHKSEIIIDSECSETREGSPSAPECDNVHNEICALLGYYAASCRNCLPTFRDNVSVPSSRVKSLSRKERKPATYNVEHGKARGIVQL
jgi:hypothetical protein